MTLDAVYSTISAASIIEVVKAHYAVGQVRRCRLFTRGFYDTYEFEVEAGDAQGG
jgi:hypothetical protein